MERTFTFTEVNKDLKVKYNITYNDTDYLWLVSGYSDIDTKFSIYQSLLTGSLLFKKQRGPKYCIGSNLKKSTFKYFTFTPKKYDKYFIELKEKYNNHLETKSKELNKSFILI